MENKEDIYASHMQPLIKSLYLIAKEHNIPFVMVVQTSDEGRATTYYLPPETHKEMRQLWNWLEKG